MIIIFDIVQHAAGILALTRQWKNQLYMPTLVETQARKRRGAFTVHFDVPRGNLSVCFYPIACIYLALSIIVKQ